MVLIPFREIWIPVSTGMTIGAEVSIVYTAKLPLALATISGMSSRNLSTSSRLE